MRRLGRWYGRLIGGLGLAGGVAFGAMALGICIDVALRALFGTTISWIIEIFEYAMLVATMLAAPWVLREGGHVTLEIVTGLLGPRLRRATAILAAATGTAICLVMLYYSAIATWGAFVRGSMIFKTLAFPEWWVLALVPLGMALIAIEFLRQGVLLAAGRSPDEA